MRDDHGSLSEPEHTPHAFDVQRASVLTPEGGIESAGHFARGFGADRLRRAIVVAFVGTVALIAVAFVGTVALIAVLVVVEVM